MTGYFSDRELGPKPRILQDIEMNVWGGILVILTNKIEDGSLGYRFPIHCPDTAGIICGCDQHKLTLMMEAEIPSLKWPLDRFTLPSKYDIFDLLEIVYQSIAYPVQGNYHSYFQHYHLSFEIDKGKELFRNEINRLFSRNGIAFEINTEGQVIRLVNEVLRNDLMATLFNTGDSGLDILLETARRKYLSPHPDIRKEGLDKLWDAWERLKSLEHSDKKVSTERLLQKVSVDSAIYEQLDSEARSLTGIGNKFTIRHTEKDKIPLDDSDLVDYLFHRLFALVLLLLKKTRRYTYQEIPDEDTPF